MQETKGKRNIRYVYKLILASTPGIVDSASVCGPEGGGFESYQSYVRVHSPD